MRKKAIVIVSFGSTEREARMTLKEIEGHIREAFPEHDVFHAFTSLKIRSILREREEIHMPSLSEILNELEEAGVEEIFCQPTHLIEGREYEKIKECIGERTNIRCGTPIFMDVNHRERLVKHFMNLLPKKEGVLFVGHGSKKGENEIYEDFERLFHENGYENVQVATLRGKDSGFDRIEKKLEKLNVKKVQIRLLLVSTGMHVKKDILGGETSWKHQLEEMGYEVEPLLHGLGQENIICGMYIEEIRNMQKRSE